MSDQPRPVWLNRNQRDGLRALYERNTGIPHVGEVVAAWDAAPANARAEIIKALATGRTIDYHIWFRGDAADGVLRALGMPDA